MEGDASPEERIRKARVYELMEWCEDLMERWVLARSQRPAPSLSPPQTAGDMIAGGEYICT